LKLVEEFCELFDCRHLSVSSSMITHLILPDTRVKKRTMKFILSILRGNWLVSMEWIKQSVTHKKILPEAEYQVIGDLKSDGGPEKARQQDKKKPFFYEHAFIVETKECKCQWSRSELKAELKEIIEAGGGLVIENIQSFMKSQNSQRQYLHLLFDSTNPPLAQQNLTLACEFKLSLNLPRTSPHQFLTTCTSDLFDAISRWDVNQIVVESIS
jgi:hypothetical protein